LDGSTVGFPVDIDRFYSLAGTWHEDVTLAGGDTILVQESALSHAPQPGPNAAGPLLAVVDGRGRVTVWQALLNAGYWSGVVVLRAGVSRPHGGTAAEEIVTGAHHVDLAAVLAEFKRRGAHIVRVDSGGGLTGALLTAHLVDEVSLLIHPVVAGNDHRWHGAAVLPHTRLELRDCQRLDGDDGLAWLRYDVEH
ncbi:dihydrofolate reductase family protein, partial [Nakamurella sp. GG22]